LSIFGELFSNDLGEGGNSRDYSIEGDEKDHENEEESFFLAEQFTE